MAKAQEMRTEALERAVSGQSMTNYPTIIAGFIAKGIPEAEIEPRSNVFTYKAWQALGRQVRKGEKGVKVVTYVPFFGTDPKTGERKQTGCRPWTTTVFHVSQTDAMTEAQTARVRTAEPKPVRKGDVAKLRKAIEGKGEGRTAKRGTGERAVRLSSASVSKGFAEGERVVGVVPSSLFG